MNFPLSLDMLPARIQLDRPMTDEEFMEFSGRFEAWPMEREPNGDILVMTPVNHRGSRMNGRITTFLCKWSMEDGRGDCTGPDGGYTLPDKSVRAPDGAWCSHERFNKVPRHLQEGYAHVCPEFIIELRSPSDRLKAAKEKMQMWIDNGAEVAWLIDPTTRTVTIYRPNEAPEELLDPTSVQGTGPILGFELVMEEVWGTQAT